MNNYIVYIGPKYGPWKLNIHLHTADDKLYLLSDSRVSPLNLDIILFMPLTEHATFCRTHERALSI